MYVRAPARLISSACWVTVLDVVLTGVAWIWAEDWNGTSFWHHQVRKAPRSAGKKGFGIAGSADCWHQQAWFEQVRGVLLLLAAQISGTSRQGL